MNRSYWVPGSYIIKRRFEKLPELWHDSHATSSLQTRKEHQFSPVKNNTNNHQSHALSCSRLQLLAKLLLRLRAVEGASAQA